MSTVCVTVDCGSGITYPLRRARRYVLPFNQNYTIFLQRVEYLIQVGESTAAPIYTRFSKDGGQTWMEWVTLDAGALGDYFKRVFTNVNSSGRNWIGEIVVDAPFKWYLVDAFCDFEQGEN